MEKTNDIKKLNIGCGYDYRKGWINLDDQIDNRLKPEVVHDLNKYPYPFKDNTFDYILASHVLEHLDRPLDCLKELWRISKPHATIQIKVPYFTSWCAWEDITHKRPFTYNSFSALCLKNTESNIAYVPNLFKYKKRKLVWGTSNKPIIKQFASFMNWLVNINPVFMEKRMTFLIPVESLHLELSVIK